MTINIYIFLAFFTFLSAGIIHYASTNWMHFECNFNRKQSELKDYHAYLIVFVCIAFAFRMLLCGSYREVGDMSAFASWSNTVFKEGFTKFYSNHGATTYPPLYIFILYIIGAIKNLFGIADMSIQHIILLKLPSIIMDMAAGIFIYKIARSKFTHITAILLACFYWFNPAVIINSTIWGQVDVFYSFAIAVMCYLLYKKKLIPACIAFAISFLLKSQTIIFTPILICGFIDMVFLDNFSFKKLRKYLLGGLGAVGIILLIYLPFVLGGNSHSNLVDAVKQFISSLNAFAYASVNAFNFWTMVGMNITDQNTTFLFLPAVVWGYLSIVLLTIGAVLISWKCKKNTAKYSYIGAYIITTLFLFSVRMHERYLFPALILLLLSYILTPKKEILKTFGYLSALQFANVAYILFIRPGTPQYSKNMIPIFLSALTIAVWFYMLFTIKQYFWNDTPFILETDSQYIKDLQNSQNKEHTKKKTNKQKKDTNKKHKREDTSEKEFHFFTGRENGSLTKWDFLIMLIITVVYACFAFHDLGSHKMPNTGWEATDQDYEIVLDFGKKVDIKELHYFVGGYDNCTYELSYTSMQQPDSASWTSTPIMNAGDVYKWNHYNLNTSMQYLKLSATFYPSELLELVFIDSDGNQIVPVNSSDYKTLFDEADMYKEQVTYRDETYFDEIYHARTAYEYITDRTTYETTHPPLGKILIALGIKIFGFNPFGWRFMGTLFGVLMLPLLYIFAKRMFKQTWIGAVVCLLFAFDFMHFTQTRIATIDVYITFFIILMYYFMYRYTSMSFYTSKLTKTWIPLGLCGISMGLGVASKWTGAYAGVGLAVIFFWHLFNRYVEYNYAKDHPGLTTDGVEHDYVKSVFMPHMIKTLLFCIVFFICIPGLIYVLSYIPFVSPSGETNLIQKIIENQQYMFDYHSQLTDTHGYSSKWYEWPMIVKPILYYSRSVTDTTAEAISSMGNPLVWWVGAIALLYVAYRAIKNREGVAGFLTIGFLSQYLPWVLVSRTTFIYHYFTSVPFVILAIGYSICQLYKNRDEKKKKSFQVAVGVYCILALLLFLYFYPVIAGQPVVIDKVQQMYCWFTKWYMLVLD